MPISESRRHDLYNGLTELLGEERADTLMAYLPLHEGTDLATKADLAAVEMSLSARIDRLETTVITRLTSMDQRFEALGQRLDRIVLALVAGLVAITAALVAQSFI